MTASCPKPDLKGANKDSNRVNQSTYKSHGPGTDTCGASRVQERGSDIQRPLSRLFSNVKPHKPINTKSR